MSAFPSRAMARALWTPFALFPALLATPALAASVYVTVGGTDSGTCGDKLDPCRSITQGIANSAVGGAVLVGPGAYGDVDRDGTLGEPGEEPAPALCGTGTCMIHVDKHVTLLSTSGALATVLVPGPASIDSTVFIDAPEAVFGAVGRGFTVASPAGSGSAAVTSEAASPGATIEGNYIQSVGDSALGIVVSSNHQVLNNRVLGTYNASGIFLFGDSNVASGNVAVGGAQGLRVYGNDNLLANNVANGNEVGLEIGSGTGNTVTKCSFLGNGFAGVYVGSAAATGSVTESNIVGNATHAAAANCGFEAGGSAVTATDVWWGAAAGPGADPADDACNEAVGATTPFATSPFKVKVKGIR